MLYTTGGVCRFSLSRLASLLLFAAIAAPCADHPSDSINSQPTVTSVTQITRDGVSKTNLLADESSLYVTEWPAARHLVARVSLQGADRAVISNAFPNVQAMDISADRSKLLVAPIQGGADSEFWTLPTHDGSPKRVGEMTGRDAAWSVDGQQLVFGKGSKLYLAKADGSSAHEIFAATGSVFGSRFSRDGKRIRFTVGNADQNATSLWEVGSDGSNPHALLGKWQSANAACCGNWTADGRYYIFQVNQSAPTAITTLWALAESGSMGTPVQLTRGPMSFGNASPAADSKKIWAIGVQPFGEAVKYDAATKSFVPLLSSVSATDLNYSPDGKWVAFVSVPDATLWRCRADGSEKVQLTKAPERVALPRWSRDASRIAYVSMEPGSPARISIVSRAGGDAQAMLKESRGQIDANWSEDGNHILFGYFHDTADLDIRMIDLKTHQVTTIPGSQGLFSPRWSPNGKYIAALSPDFTKVMLFDFQTQKWTDWLAEPAGAVNYPEWSADSQYLYFDDLVTDEESIRRVKVGESHADRVFKLEGIERYPGPFGLWSGRTADGSWMFVRDRSTQEVYQLSVVLP
jgi:Tol biopolymer transport system component